MGVLTAIRSNVLRIKFMKKKTKLKTKIYKNVYTKNDKN